MVSIVRSASGSGNSTTPSATFATAPDLGDLLVAYVGFTNVDVLTAFGSWTKVAASEANTAGRGAAFWRLAPGGTTVFQAASIAAARTWGCFIDQINDPNGWSAIDPVDVANAQAVASGSASYTTPTVTQTDGDRYVLVGFACGAPAQAWSAEAVSGAGVGTITERGDVNGQAMASGVITAGSGNHQGSATKSNTGPGNDAIAIFKPNAAAAKAPPPFSRPTRIWTRRR